MLINFVCFFFLFCEWFQCRYWSAYMLWIAGDWTISHWSNRSIGWYVPTDNQWKSINIRWPMAVPIAIQRQSCALRIIMFSKNPCRHCMVWNFSPELYMPESRRPFDFVACCTDWCILIILIYRSSKHFIVYTIRFNTHIWPIICNLQFRII